MLSILLPLLMVVSVIGVGGGFMRSYLLLSCGLTLRLSLPSSLRGVIWRVFAGCY